jgi:hypothetical protein
LAKDKSGKIVMTSGKTILRIINEHEPDRDFNRKYVCSTNCAEVAPGCSCSFLDLFVKHKFVEVS